MSTHDEASSGMSTGKYIVGFILAVILTLLSFIPVMNGYLDGFSPALKVTYLIGIAVIQMVVQIVFFLHLNHGPNAKWMVGTMWFAALCVIIIIGGSWFAMNHLNWNMMGGSGRIDVPTDISITGEAVPGTPAPAAEGTENQ